ncbi:membrane protein FAM174B [Eublepharis macularius]|uniref:Membrane protein FAM174B n=1 Tax=Eublepharis macularius TaxID=481883 RepID=A0AA97LKN6_EUBMA|nr:membrane protein FAM174B [Eublepharis macularius]
MRPSPLPLLLLLPALAAALRLPPASPTNASRPGPLAPAEPPAGNGSAAPGLPESGWAVLRDLPALQAGVLGACAAGAALLACLLLRVLRSGRKVKKTRKYDIITTPMERVEMAPLNEEEDEEEDSTVFDIKYR